MNFSRFFIKCPPWRTLLPKRWTNYKTKKKRTLQTLKITDKPQFFVNMIYKLKILRNIGKPITNLRPTKETLNIAKIV